MSKGQVCKSCPARIEIKARDRGGPAGKNHSGDRQTHGEVAGDGAGAYRRQTAAKRSGPELAESGDSQMAKRKARLVGNSNLLFGCYGDGSRAQTRVALMDFAVDDNSYRSVAAAATFYDHLAKFDWAVKHTRSGGSACQLERVRHELIFRRRLKIPCVSGELVKAGLRSTGQFSLDVEMPGHCS